MPKPTQERRQFVKTDKINKQSIFLFATEYSKQNTIRKNIPISGCALVKFLDAL